MEEGKKMDSKVLKTIAFAAAASLFISGLKVSLPSFFRRWSVTVAATSPPPLLFLLLHLTVASIVLISIHQSLVIPASLRCIGRHGRRRGSKRKKSSAKEKIKWEERQAEEEEGDAEELNAKVEAFIQEFRQQLRIESLSSTFKDSNI